MCASPIDHDYPKFVYQTPDINKAAEQLPQPPKPFSLNNSKKPEKKKKLPKPFEPKQKNEEEELDPE